MRNVFFFKCWSALNAMINMPTDKEIFAPVWHDTKNQPTCYETHINVEYGPNLFSLKSEYTIKIAMNLTLYWVSRSCGRWKERYIVI